MAPKIDVERTASQSPSRIEPNLRVNSPENGNNADDAQRYLGREARQPPKRQVPRREIPANGGLYRHFTVKISGARTGWLGREGSNLRMAESKSAALPLGYAPTMP